MNVLLTCVGRRNYLVEFFQQALGAAGRVLACDSSPAAPGLQAADRSCVVPAMDDAGYFDALLRICREEDVHLLLSVNDLELAGLARNRMGFRDVGTRAVIASPQTIALCQDKWQTFEFLRAAGIGTPRTYRSMAAVRAALSEGVIRFPLVMKPRGGTSSIGVERVENERELELAYEWGQIQMRRTILARLLPIEPADAFIFQEWLPGQEFGLDVVNDLDGRHVCTLARRKLVMRAGNTDRAVSIREAGLDQLGRKLGDLLAHPGCLDCDVIQTESGYQVLDLNPRFGGGYPFSHLAGANLPAALIAWSRGMTPDPAWFDVRPGVVVSKSDHMMIVPPNEPPAPISKVSFVTASAPVLEAAVQPVAGEA